MIGSNFTELTGLMLGKLESLLIVESKVGERKSAPTPVLLLLLGVSISKLSLMDMSSSSCEKNNCSLHDHDFWNGVRFKLPCLELGVPEFPLPGEVDVPSPAALLLSAM